MIDISQYHWVWYLLGFMFAPRLTIMIGLSIYCKGLPLPLMVIGWILAIFETISFEKKGYKKTWK